MIDRLRLLLDRPLDPPVARAVVVLATALLLGFAAVVVLGASERQHLPPPPEPIVSGAAGASIPDASASEAGSSVSRRPPHRRQDPQDATGSAAAKRATVESRSHRALQHVPYRRGVVAIHLVGARGGRALLRVSAPTISAARRGWRAFLHRFDDDGHSYVPLFKGRAGTVSVPAAPRAGA